jgi:hypothetical protein
MALSNLSARAVWPSGLAGMALLNRRTAGEAEGDREIT